MLQGGEMAGKRYRRPSLPLCLVRGSIRELLQIMLN
jgi:hypothetical protein